MLIKYDIFQERHRFVTPLVLYSTYGNTKSSDFEQPTLDMR